MSLAVLAKRPILLVEDDAATAELERRALVRVGRTVRTTDRAEEAVGILQSEAILVVVLDYRLKDGHAWPVLEAAHSVRPRVPVIVVTAMGDEKIAAEAVHRGATDYLIKSGDFSVQLPPVVDRAIRIAEAELANARLASIVEYSQDAIIGATLDGHILSWNQGARRLFGLSEEEALGKSILLLAAEDRTVEFAELRERIKRGGEVPAFETVGQRKDGRRIELSVTLSAVRDQAGEPNGLSLVARDITELRRMQAEVIRTQSLAAVGEMAATVAHEIKNPLAAISGPIQILADDLKADDPRKDLMKEILGQVKRLDGTVRGLLAISKPYAPQKQPVLLRDLLERIVRLMAEHASGRGVRFSVAGGEGLTFSADPALLEQVFWNLFLNAAEAMKGKGEIKVSMNASARTVELIVADSGGGISPDVLPKIFRPFVTTKPSGTGLGLPLCRKIVEAHGGTIEITSEVGQGTTARLQFPTT